MAYEIYTFGNGEILKGVFDSIAMCLNGHSGTLIEPLKRIGLIIGAFWAAIYALFGDQVSVLTHWIMPMVAVSNLLFIPTTSVWIHDPITHYHQKVDHVPYGLAAFAGNISKIGYFMTEQVEKVFSLPDDLKYQKSGTVFASNIMMQAKKFRIVNDDIAQNMRGFVGHCVVYDLALGRKYTIQDLKNSDDIWGLISQKASPNRSFAWHDPATKRTEIITCLEGVQKFNAVLNQEIDRTASVYGKRIFGKGGVVDAKVELLKYLPLAYSSLGNIAKSATDILKQQMMITSIVDGIESGSQRVGNAPNFAAKRAYLQQRSTYETLGAMAADSLPTMKAVLEAIAYACFLFVIPLCLLPFGYNFLFRWVQILLWLQIWAPLYAILNFIMTMAAKSKTLGALNLSHTLSDENAKRLAEDVSGSYEKGMQQRSDASKSFSEAENYQQQAMFTKANAASINRNANQEFFEWMANQPADNAPGKMGKQEAAYLMAHQPALTMEYARRFSHEKGFNQGSTNFESQQQSLRMRYDQESRQNAYAVTKDSMKSVQNQGERELSSERGFESYSSRREPINESSMNQNVGSNLYEKYDTHSNRSHPSIEQSSERQYSHPIRQKVESMQKDKKLNMDHDLNTLQEKGHGIKDNLLENQQKGVVRRVGAKGIKEAKETVKNALNIKSGESQQG